LLRGDHDDYEEKLQGALVGEPVIPAVKGAVLLCAAAVRMHYNHPLPHVWGSFEHGEPTEGQQLGLAALVAALNADVAGLHHAIVNATHTELIEAVRVVTHTTARLITEAIHHHREAS
jgi:hypothetical protein